MTNHGLTAENFISTLPQVLQDDPSCRTLAIGISTELENLFLNAERLNIYSKIDNAPESLLDLLATDLKIDWWRSNATLQEKRELVKFAWFVHRHIGTKAAVERAVESFLGSGDVEEWFDYGGQPMHFRIVNAKVSAVNEHFDEFMRVLGSVQRGSSVLDTVATKIQCDIRNQITVATMYHTVMAVGCNDVDDSLLHMYATESANILTDENWNVLLDESGNAIME